jgi:hypothetical protein
LAAWPAGNEPEKLNLAWRSAQGGIIGEDGVNYSTEGGKRQGINCSMMQYYMDYDSPAIVVAAYIYD